MTVLRPVFNRLRLNDDDEMNSVLESIFNAPRMRSRLYTPENPNVDIIEDDNGATIYMELPGVEKGDVKVKIENETLSITATRKPIFDENKAKLIRNEIYSGGISRNFSIAKNIDAHKISAEFKNGLLIITLPKAEKAKPKEIDINIS